MVVVLWCFLSFIYLYLGNNLTHILNTIFTYFNIYKLIFWVLEIGWLMKWCTK